MSQKQIKLLFLFSFIAIVITYSVFLGEVKTIGLFIDEYLFILALIPLWIISFYYKRKLKNIEIIDFNANGNFTLKSTILFFLVFQVIDYISENGFIGMISQWFLYWVMGIISFMILNIVNYYRNYKVIKLLEEKPLSF